MFQAIATLLLALVTLIIVDKISKKKRCLPPGPASYPFIGQLLSAPVSFEHVEYKRMSKDLKSDIISLEFLGNTIVVLNSAQSANDLLDKRSAIYSDRTLAAMVEHEQLLNWRDNVSLTPYGDRFRAYRRVFNTWLNKNASTAFQQGHLVNTRKMLQRLLQHDGKVMLSKTLEDELSAASIMKAAYGYEVTSPDNSYVAKIKQVDENLTKSFFPTQFLVNIFPFLVHVPSWFPGAGWKRTAKEWRELKDEVIEDTFRWTKTQMDNGIAEPSIVRAYLEDLASRGDTSEEKVDIIKHVGISLFGAGTDTTATSLEVFVLAMLLFPNVQRKAQEEIDRVIGPSRLPEIDDLGSLPYVSNLVQEVLRWQTVFQIGVPHTCSQDDIYRGYFIPKGAIVIGNAWAISRDETVYVRPEEFNPDRFDDPSVPPAPAFGWGRRKCPGIHYAQSLLSIGIASLLATFDFTMAKDEEGNDIVPSVEDVPTLAYRPIPFTCVITCRSAHRRRLISDSV
ncbi:unnamed protein product [Rhizoctonia solani]|uniref:O-methylsterigmatocystin oxidoreductase n=1 Tax=Rhizoctonia solani TaxID=456999 RepID=A0A8H3HR08_9AGAM|nr:unnamed protein product [Rhizoctonia solani]